MCERLDEALLAEMHRARELATRERLVAVGAVMLVPRRMIVGDVVGTDVDVFAKVVVIVRREIPSVFVSRTRASIGPHRVDERTKQQQQRHAERDLHRDLESFENFPHAGQTPGARGLFQCG
jgi:hypothetical protein